MKYSEEIQFFSKPFLIIIAVLVIAGLWLVMIGISNAGWVIIVAVLFPLLFGRLHITVKGNTLRVDFGYLGILKKEILISDIRESRVVDYRPIVQFGGWGIRCGRFEGEPTGCYSLKGKRGLLLLLTRKMKACIIKTDRILIGCNEPEKLKASIGK